MRYQIVRSPGIEGLQLLVSQAIEDGWQCQGSPHQQGMDDGRTVWIQAMTRPAQEEGVRLREPKRR